MRKTFIAALIVLIVAVFFRFYNITSLPPGLYPDEAMNGSNAEEALQKKDFKVFYPENNGREGLFINIQAGFMKVFGNEPFALRSAAALFGVLTVLGIFFLTRELMKRKDEENDENQPMGMVRSDRIAFFASLFAAVGLWAVLFSRIGFRANMAPCFLTWSLFLLIRSLPLIKEKFVKAISLMTIGGFIFGLGMHSYIAYRATPIIIAIIFFTKLGQAIRERYTGKFMSVFIAFTAASIIAFAPLALYFVAHPADFMGRTTQVSALSDGSPVKALLINTVKTIGMFNVVGDFNWRHNYSGDPILSPVVGGLFLIGIALCIASIIVSVRKKISDKDLFPAIVIFSAFGVALLPVIASSEGIPHALRAILAVPPVFILAGIGADWLFIRLKAWLNETETAKTVYRASIAAFTIFIILEGYVLYFVRWGGNPNVPGAYAQNFVDMARDINSLPISVKKYVLVKAGGTDVRGWPMPTQTVMFMTNTFIPENRPAKNIVYIRNLSEIPEGEAGYRLFEIN
ncbi:MAG: hypothetical protein PHG66_02190 [Candidatus Colwellbacteria bacterium]|nr:hypothetical protein [Candidatus Colwellbacteria bacterium]